CSFLGVNMLRLFPLRLLTSLRITAYQIGLSNCKTMNNDITVFPIQTVDWHKKRTGPIRRFCPLLERFNRLFHVSPKNRSSADDVGHAKLPAPYVSFHPSSLTGCSRSRSGSRTCSS